MRARKTATEKSPIKVYLILVLGICFALGILELIAGYGKFYRFLQIGFTFIPVLCAAAAKRLTGKRSSYHLSLKVWKNGKAWAFSALVPAVLVAAGAAVYFFIFPKKYSGILKYGVLFGSEAELTVRNPRVLSLAVIMVSAIAIPIQLLELGEEIGWRGYLLSFQIEKYGEKKAVLVNGVEWGIAHLPLIYFGFNYSMSNAGAPWTNMAMMCLTCVVLGIMLSYVTIRTGNCMYAAIAHGALNVIGEVPVFLTNDRESGLLGPNPTGLIGMSFLIVLALHQLEQRLAAGELWQGWQSQEDMKTALVFLRDDGSNITAAALYQRYKHLAEKIRKPESRVHDLRHTFAVLSLQNGDNVKTVQDNLGHATAAFTLDVYGHVSERMKEDSAVRMQAYIDNMA